MVSQLLDLVQGLQSLSCQVMKTSDSVSVVVKKKRWPNFKIPVIYEV